MDIRKVEKEFVRREFQRHRVVAKNVFLYSNWCEMDIAGLRKSGFLDEVEIKLSRADYLADFKKTVGNIYQVHRNKHVALEAGELAPNYFYFMMPEDMVPLTEIPDYAGVYYFKETEKGFIVLSEARAPKRLHNRKLSDHLKFNLAAKMAYRYWRELDLDL